MKILVASDRSEESTNALANALDLVDVADAELTVVHVIDDPTRTEAAVDENEVLEAALEQAADRGVAIETELLVGDPVEVIPEHAEANGFDVIYVGHRGLVPENEELSGEDRETLGSVSRGIIENTRVPVTVFDRRRD